MMGDSAAGHGVDVAMDALFRVCGVETVGNPDCLVEDLVRAE